MDFLWILIAFVCGFLAKQINLPPLIGYLAAGFGLHSFGVEPHSNLQSLANLGITLMLFTIGLKINFKTLLKPSVWAGTSIQRKSIIKVTGLYWHQLHRKPKLACLNVDCFCIEFFKHGMCG